MRVFRFRNNNSKYAKRYLMNGEVSLIKYTNNVYNFRILKFKRFIRCNKITIIIVIVGITISCLMVYSVW